MFHTLFINSERTNAWNSLLHTFTIYNKIFGGWLTKSGCLNSQGLSSLKKMLIAEFYIPVSL